MKYLLALLLLIGLSVKGQDSLTFDSIGIRSPHFEVGKYSGGSWMFLCQDSNHRIVAYQKKDSGLVVIDSGAAISVMVKCLQWQYEYNEKQWAKRGSVKWKPIYVKKKHHQNNNAPKLLYGTLSVDKRPFADEDTAWFEPYLQRHSHGMDSVYYGGKYYAKKDLPIVVPSPTDSLGRRNCDLRILGATDIRLGGQLQQATTISGANTFPLIIDTVYSSKGKGFKAGFIWDMRAIEEPYPWWKKALWVLLGMVILTVAVFFVALFDEAKKD